MSNYDVTKARIFQWLGIILIMAVFSGAYWYFKVYGSTLNQSQNDLNTNGLVGLWSFNGDDISGTTAYDRSGSGNNGTLTNGPAVTDGKVGQALSFDGTDDYVTVADTNALSPVVNDLSISVWAKVPVNAPSVGAGCGNAGRNILGKGGGSGWEYSIENDANSLICFNLFTSTGTGYGSLSKSMNVNDGRWHQYVMTIDYGVLLSAYIDGVLVGSTASFAGSMSNTNSSLRIGDRGDGSYLSGSIDEVRIYNRAITASEVASLYTQGGGTKVNTAVSQPQGTGRLDSGLAGYWKLDDGSGTSATDASTNGNTGTLTNGPTWTTGQIGSAVTFDGTDDYIDLGSITSMNGQSALTISAWINPTTLTNYAGIVGKYSDLSTDTTLQLGGSGVGSTSSLVAAIRNGSNSYGYTATGKIVTGTWTHCVMVFDGSQSGNSNRLKIYVNGVSEPLTFSGTIPSTTTGYPQNLRIGRNGIATDYFNSKIDEVRVYNRSLSADEVSQLYRLNTPTSVDTSLKGYWSFNAPDMTSTTAYDQSGAGDYGVLSNSPAITEGVVGQALLFDGNNDYVNFGVNSVNPRLSGASAITVATWMKPLSYPGNNVGERAFDVQIQNGTVGVFLGLYDDSGLISFGGRSQTSDGSQGTTTYAYPSLNEWHHVIGVMDIANDVVRLYVDGALVTSVAVSFGATTYTPGTPTTSLDTLGSNIGFDQFYHGALDETRVYNRALTTAEIKSLYDVGQSDKVNSSASQPQGTGRLDSGLAGYWKLDDGSGTSATDASTNGNTGTLTNGPTWTTGQIGGAVDFDGTNDYITVGDRLDVTDNADFSLAGWFNSDDVVNWHGLIAKRNSGDIPGFDVVINANKINAYLSDTGASTYSLTGTTTLSTSTWYHFVFVFDDDSTSLTQIYLNGKSENSTKTGTLSNINDMSNAYSLNFGRLSDNVALYNGKLDEVRIYNRALSPDEVSQLYQLNSPTGTDTGLKGYWSFNGKDMSGTTAYDRSGAGNTGTLTNGPAITEGKLGQALNFDGVDDYVTAGSASVIDNIQTLTVSAWIKTRTYSNLPNIFNKAGVGGGWQVNLCQNSIGVCANAGQTNAFHFVRACEGIGTVRTRSPENSISTNTWQHLAITNDNSAGANTTKFYVNGSLVATDASACVTPRDESSNNLLIGSANGGGQFDGLIDEARLYNRVLTESEIKSLYNSSR